MLHIICLLDSETPTATNTDKVKPDSQVQPLEPCMEDYMVVYASHPGMNIIIILVSITITQTPIA